MERQGGFTLRLPDPIVRAGRFVRAVFERFSEDNGGMVAAAVSFYVFMSLIPMLLIAVAVAGYVLGSPERSQELVVGWVNKYGLTEQAGDEITSILREVIEGRGAATGASLLILLWTVTTAVSNLEKAINVAWNVEQARGFVMQRLLALLVCAGGAALLGLSFVLTAGLKLVKNLDVSILGMTPGSWPWIWELLGFAAPILVTVLAFTMIYKVMPNTAVSTRIALIGGIVAGVLWELAKHAFSYYVNNFADYSRVYGSLGGVILLLVWINYSALVTVLGAEVASLADRRRG